MPCPGGGILFRSRRTPSSAGQCRGTARAPRGISFAARTVISASPALSGGLSGGEWTLPVARRQSGEEKVRETCRSSSAFCQPYHHPFFFCWFRRRIRAFTGRSASSALSQNPCRSPMVSRRGHGHTRQGNPGEPRYLQDSARLAPACPVLQPGRPAAVPAGGQG